MKTSELVNVLACDLDRVDHRAVDRALIIAIFTNVVVASVSGLLFLGARQDAVDRDAIIFLCGKIVFASILTAVAAFYLFRCARPGRLGKVPAIKVVWPLLVIVGLAVATLAMTPTPLWHREILGDHWLECLIAIPAFAIVPFAIINLALKKAAPTDLNRAGALTGLVAGGFGAIGYSLHCVDDTVPFIALWYGLAIVACGLVGAALGPRLLRW